MPRGSSCCVSLLARFPVSAFSWLRRARMPPLTLRRFSIESETGVRQHMRPPSQQLCQNWSRSCRIQLNAIPLCRMVFSESPSMSGVPYSSQTLIACTYHNSAKATLRDVLGLLLPETILETPSSAVLWQCRIAARIQRCQCQSSIRKLQVIAASLQPENLEIPRNIVYVAVQNCSAVLALRSAKLK